MARLMDLTGQRFGRLTVIERVKREKGEQGSALWRCKCDCGNETISTSQALRNGRAKSCGCYAKEVRKQLSTKHGGHKERLYGVWQDMKRRCESSYCASYKNYGGRGISVCDEWRDDYKAFRAWAFANGYNESETRGKCELDRIDVNGNYCPENCRWTTHAEQCRNKRNNYNITYKGETLNFVDWAVILFVTQSKFRNMIDNYGEENAIEHLLKTRAERVAEAKKIIKAVQ